MHSNNLSSLLNVANACIMNMPGAEIKQGLVLQHCLYRHAICSQSLREQMANHFLQSWAQCQLRAMKKSWDRRLKS